MEPLGSNEIEEVRALLRQLRMERCKQKIQAALQEERCHFVSDDVPIRPNELADRQEK